MHPNAIILGGGIALAAMPLRAADIFKADNGFVYNLEDSWVGEVVPGSDDIAVFDATLTTAPKPAIGSSLSWGGIRADASLGVGVTFGNTAGAVLTVGSGGILHQSTGAGALTIASNFAASANQTWNAAAGTAKDAISFTIPATMDLGGCTVSRTGAGRVNLTVGSGSTSISNGSLWLRDGTTEYRSASGAATVPASFTVRVDNGATWITSRGSSLANSFTWNGNIQLNGGSWQVSGATHPVNIAGTITAQSGSTILYSQGTGTTAVDHTISAPISGTGALAIRNTSANPNHRITLSDDNSGHTGGITLDGASGSRTVRLTSAAGAAATSDLTVSGGNFGGSFSDGGGSLAVTKTGGGTLRLDGVSTHSGLTDVQGGTLSGTGSLAGSLRIRDGAAISPGNLTGSFSLGGSFTQDFGSVYLAQIANPSSMDLVSLFGAGGQIAFDGTLKVALLDGFAPALGDAFDVFDWTAGYTVSGNPDFDLPALSAGLSWSTSSFLADGSISVIPEPSSLLLAGMSCLLLARRSPQRRACARPR